MTLTQDIADARSAAFRVDRHMAKQRERQRDPKPVSAHIALKLCDRSREAIAYAMDAWERGGLSRSKTEFIRYAIISSAQRVAELEMNQAGFFSPANNPNIRK